MNFTCFLVSSACGRSGFGLAAVLAVMVVPALLSVPAKAQDSAVRLDVELRVLPGCSFLSGADNTLLSDAVISFGSAAADEDAPVDAMAAFAGGLALNLVCSTSYTDDAAPTLSIDAGLHAEGGQRYMLGPQGARVAYELFQDQARNRPYDPATAVQLIIPTAGAATPIPVYGRVPAVTGLPAGRYTDTVTLTLTY